MNKTTMLGVGLQFPFTFQPHTGGTAVSMSHAREHAHIRESIVQILGTRLGERLMNPQFGSKLHDLVFEQNDDVLQGLIRHHVIDAIRRWEKRVVITDVSCDVHEADRHQPGIIIAYRVQMTQITDQLVYPFWREPL